MERIENKFDWSFPRKNGGRNNTSAWIGIVPSAGVGVAVMVNCGDAEVERIGRWLLERSVPDADLSGLNRRPHFAMVAPFTGVCWESDADQPTVQVRGKWMRLISIAGIPIEQIMNTAREKFGNRAQMRFSEDLVELLAATGHKPNWTLTLMVDRSDGAETIRYEEVMTEQNRETVRESRLRTPAR